MAASSIHHNGPSSYIAIYAVMDSIHACIASYDVVHASKGSMLLLSTSKPSEGRVRLWVTYSSYHKSCVGCKAKLVSGLCNKYNVQGLSCPSDILMR